MIIYDVSFLKNAVYQANLVKTDKSPEDLAKRYAEHNPGAKVIGVSIATSDSIKPGKPCITV